MAMSASLETRVSPSLRAYAQNINALRDSAIRISTGNRIVRNGDDPASLSAATKLQTQTSTLRSTLVSGARATSFLQVASDGLSQVRDILTHLSDLTAQANAAGQTKLSYATLNAQFQTAFLQINTVVAATKFNGTSILNGSASGSGAPYIQVGATSNDSVSLAIPDVSTAGLFSTTPTINTAVSATAATTSVGTAGNLVDDAIAKVDAYQRRLDLADETTRKIIGGIDDGIGSLLNTDLVTENQKVDRIEREQRTAAALLAQAFGLNSSLLGLLHTHH